MNIVTVAVGAVSIAGACIVGNFAFDLVGDFVNMNSAVAKSLKTGDLNMEGARKQIDKACATSATFLSTQGRPGVRCDQTSGTVNF